jgi:hypothetical protein
MPVELASNNRLAFIEATLADPTIHGAQLLNAFRLANIAWCDAVQGGDLVNVEAQRMSTFSDQLGSLITERVNKNLDRWHVEKVVGVGIEPDRMAELELNLMRGIGTLVTAREALYFFDTDRLDPVLHIVQQDQPEHESGPT